MSDIKINRRNFLSTAARGLAGACVALSPLPAWSRMCGGMMGGRMMGDATGCGGMYRGTASVIDPPPGPVFMDPVELAGRSVSPGTKAVSLEAKPAAVRLNGTAVNLLTYNGSFPGPTIRVKRGMRLKIDFKSALPVTNSRNLVGHERDMTNLHTHGLHVSPEGNSDNVMLHFMPGQQFAYEYDLAHQPAGSLCFYHPHVHGSVAEQYWSGMAGAIVVEDDTDVLAGYGDRLLVLKDIEFAGSQPAPHVHHMDYMMGKEGSVVTVNGQVNPVLSIKPGEVQRWRVLNASNARFYNLSLAGHTLHVVGTDGGLLDKPYPVERILLAPGERVDLLAQAGPTPGIYQLFSLPYARAHHCRLGSQWVTLMTVACEGSAVKADLPVSINPDAKKLKVEAAALPRQMISLSMGRGQGFMNGRTFGPDACSLFSRKGTYELWDVVNASPMDHPFHQHVNSAQVLAINGGDPEYAYFYSSVPGWKDTVIVPAMGSVRLLVPVMDYMGTAMMHCHIIEHEDIGMMGVWNIG